MNVILSILGATPQKSTILTPFFVQNTKNAPINCRYSGPFFSKTRVPPRLLTKIGSKCPFLPPFLGGDQATFWLDRAVFWAKVPKNGKKPRFLGPNLPILGVKVPPITCHFFALFNGKMASFFRFFDFLTLFFSNKHGQKWPSHPGKNDGPAQLAWGSIKCLIWPSLPRPYDSSRPLAAEDLLAT